MFLKTKALSSFSVDHIPEAKKFYETILGLKVTEDKEMGVLTLQLSGGGEVLIYPKPDHVPAKFTVLNFPVSDIEKSVTELKNKGIHFEHYIDTNEKGITHNEGPLIAWFKDPAGNFLSVIQNDVESFSLKKFIPSSREEVFEAFTNPEIIEKWAAPGSMTLSIPWFEAREGGRYVYKHQHNARVYVAMGRFKEYVPEEKIESICHVIGPDDEVLFQLNETVMFRDISGGCEVEIIESGFRNEQDFNDCKEGWEDCFEQLSDLMTRGVGTLSHKRGIDSVNKSLS